MMRFLKFWTAMVSTYRQWLRMVESREQQVKEYGKSGALPPSGKHPCFPTGWPHEYLVEHALAEGLINERKILKNQEAILAALDDLKTAVSTLSDNVDAFIKANTGGASDAELASVTAVVNGISAKLVTPTPAP